MFILRGPPGAAAPTVGYADGQWPSLRWLMRVRENDTSSVCRCAAATFPCQRRPKSLIWLAEQIPLGCKEKALVWVLDAKASP